MRRSATEIGRFGCSIVTSPWSLLASSVDHILRPEPDRESEHELDQQELIIAPTIEAGVEAEVEADTAAEADTEEQKEEDDDWERRSRRRRRRGLRLRPEERRTRKTVRTTNLQVDSDAKHKKDVRITEVETRQALDNETWQRERVRLWRESKKMEYQFVGLAVRLHCFNSHLRHIHVSTPV